MMDIISKWKPKESKKSSAVANYSALPGILMKVHAKKQNSGRGSDKENIGRVWSKAVHVSLTRKLGIW